MRVAFVASDPISSTQREAIEKQTKADSIVWVNANLPWLKPESEEDFDLVIFPSRGKIIPVLERAEEYQVGVLHANKVYTYNLHK